MPLLEEAGTLTTSNIFTEAGNVLSGFMTMSSNFFTSLWAQPVGKLVICIPLAGAAIGLAYKLFLRKKHVG